MAPFPITLNAPNPKVMPFFDAEYLRNGTGYRHRRRFWRATHDCVVNAIAYRHSFNKILICTYTRPDQQCYFK